MTLFYLQKMYDEHKTKAFWQRLYVSNFTIIHKDILHHDQYD
jgi:hypothetical protein